MRLVFRHRGPLVVLFALAACASCREGVAVSSAVAENNLQPERSNGRLSDRIPNSELRTHDGKLVRFYDDLVRNRTVLVNFMYATCTGVCPGSTRNLISVHEKLGDRVGDDILMLSLTIDGERVDSPQALKKYADRYGGPKDGWIYLTGDAEQIDRIRRSLGVYDLDPEVDADKTQHSGLLTFGNDRTNRWAALPALMPSDQLVEAVLRVAGDRQQRKPPDD